MGTNDLAKLSEDLMERLDGMMASDIFQQDDFYSTSQSNDATSNMAMDNVIIMHMDIREPLRTLQKLLEKKLNMRLNGYEFWLQDAQELEPHKNLVDQCVKGEGLVQINVEVKYIENRINVLDVLKPTDDALEALANDECYKSDNSADDQQSDDTEEEVPKKKARREKKPNKKLEKPCLNWVLDNNFRKEQQRLKIPNDPNNWTTAHVRYWFKWAVAEFNLEKTDIADWSLSGRELCELTHEKFCEKISKDPGNVFWTHIQLLKECKFVAVVHNTIDTELGENSEALLATKREPKIMRKANNSKKEGENGATNSDAFHTYTNCGIGSGNNGQVQLWQFLLEILTDRDNVNIIQWVGQDGEFKLIDPERVARLWGEKKKKPAMNYEKLSRALRYYYDGDMISKVTGKRFTYKFDCDLKLLIGYNAAELTVLVNEDVGSQQNIDLQRHDEYIHSKQPSTTFKKLQLGN